MCVCVRGGGVERGKVNVCVSLGVTLCVCVLNLENMYI